MKVSELMSKQVYTCHPGDRLSEAARILWEHDCGCVPVVQDSLGLVGMLTDRDICMAAYTQGSALCDMTVASAMSKNVQACNAADPVSSARDLMKGNRVRRLPVVDDTNHLVGILSLNDLALAAARNGKARGSQVSREEVADILASVCEHRELIPATG